MVVQQMLLQKLMIKVLQLVGEAVIDDVKIYQLTESGLALQATLKGTKFWKDIALN